MSDWQTNGRSHRLYQLTETTLDADDKVLLGEWPLGVNVVDQESELLDLLEKITDSEFLDKSREMIVHYCLQITIRCIKNSIIRIDAAILNRVEQG